MIALLLTGLLCAPTLSGAQDEGYRSLLKRGAYKESLDMLNKQVEPFEPNVPVHWVRERAELRFLTGEVDQAIRDYEELTEYLHNAKDTLRLAEFYHYRGRMEQYETALDDAARRLQPSWRTSSQEEYLLTAGRIAELHGEDPKRILSTTYKLIMQNRPDYVQVYVDAGDLARRKGSHAIAAGYYEDALERDEENQDALAGLAASYWASRDARLDQVLAAIDRLNPNNFDANALRVERLLDGGKIGAALDIIGAMLAINPVHRRFRALEAAAHFLNDDEDAMRKAQEAALAFNPHSSEVYRIPGRIASRHYRFKQGAALQREALAADATDHEARALLGFDLLRMGRDAEGKKELDVAFEADPYNVQVFNMLEVLDTMAGFETLTRDGFQVDLPPAQAPVLGEAVLELLLEAGPALEAKYEVELEKPVRIQIFDKHDDFIVRSVGLPGSTGHLGICFGQLLTMDSPTARPKGTMDWHSVLYHEFVHVVTLQKTKNRMPRWLSEGVSVYEETKWNPAWGMLLDPGHREIIDLDALPGTADLALYFTQPETPGHLMLGYYLAGAYVTHYTETYGEAALVDALTRIGNKARGTDALIAAAGVSEKKLDRAWHGYLETRLDPFNHLDDFAEAMEEGVAAYGEEDWKAAEAAFQRAREAFPEYNADNGPLAALYAVYKKTGNVAGQKEAVKTMLSLSSADLEGWKRLADLHKETGDWRGMADAGVAAVAVDPFDLDMAERLYEAARKIGDHELALKTAVRLGHIDPVNAVVHKLARIELLIMLSRWEDAKREVIRLLEEKPGYWKAQEILLELVEREKT